ncbi:MAG: ACT domain-containing protein [Clostridiaceae bacterium]|nr:ACT domain-containing protein [Clostridiaceae bacterium]
MWNMVLPLSVLPDELSICRLPSDSPVPDWAWNGDFCSVTRTCSELSIVAVSRFIPGDVARESSFRAIKVEGTLNFSLVGILAEISTVLAREGISIFAVSTYDTDYILVRDRDLEQAAAALRKAGHRI